MTEQRTQRGPKGQMMPGCFEQFEANSLNEALYLAEQLKASCRYRYFRGHRNAEWFVESTLARLEDEESREEARRDLSSFAGWVKSSPEVFPYLSDDDQIIATAQHHQIAATNFIDFTSDPKVAAWFAGHGGVPGERGCILLVDPDAMTKIFSAINAAFGTKIQWLQPDVSNLWRLQAQSGLFLECQTRLDTLCPFDRIVFPQTGEALPMDERIIYPDRQSHLEQQILVYHELLKRREGLRRLLEPIEGRSGPLYVEIDGLALTPDELGLQAEQFESSWVDGPDERWSEILAASSVRVPVVDTDDVVTIGEPLIQLVSNRRRAADLLRLRTDEVTRSGSLQTALDKFWTGCRPHPYSAEQLATGLSEVVRFRRGIGEFPLDEGHDIDPIAQQLMSDAVEIEIATGGGAYSRAYVAADRLWNALTQDAKLKLGILDQPADGDCLMNALAKAYGAVRPLFDPNALIALFANTIVPWQVATDREVIIFSPSHLTTLGRP